MTTPLRWTWATAAILLLVGLVLVTLQLGTAGVCTLWAALLAASVAAGVTAARDRGVARGWRGAAWLVPSLPVLAIVGSLLWIAHEDLDPMLVVMLAVVGVPVVVASWVAFVVALVVETLRRRRRRFVEARAPWENDPIPPSTS